MMKKNDVKERLKLAANLFEVANRILDYTFPDKDDYLFNLMNDLRDGEAPDFIYDKIDKDGYLDRFEPGDVNPYPFIRVVPQYPRNISIHVPLADGNYLTAFSGEADYGTHQAGICFSDSGHGFWHDFAFAEVPRNDLAKISGLKEDNNKVILYVYGDSESEDYTEKIEFDPEEILE